MSTLKSIIESFLDVFIIFDALKKCPEQYELITLFGMRHDWQIDTLHFLAGDQSKRGEHGNTELPDFICNPHG